MTSKHSSSTWQQQMDKVVEEYRDICTSPTGVPLQCQVKHPIDLTPGVPLPNGPIYQCYVLENNEIKRQIQELLQKGHIRPSSLPCGSPIVLVQKKDGTWRLYIDYRSLKISLSRIGTRSHGLMTFWTNSKGQNISTRLTWSLGINRYQSNPLMCGGLPSKPRRAFSNGWSCLSGWKILPQHSWGRWTTSCAHSPTHF